MLEIVQLILAFVLLLAGAFFTFRLRGYQFRFFFKRKRRRSASGGITPFKSLSAALAASIGTANIAGVASAIAIGGPGAVFWMWVSALLGMATKYAEVYLAMRFRLRLSDGSRCGGPMMYMRRLRRGGRALAVVFCLLALVAAVVGGAMTQGNTAAKAVESALETLGLDGGRIAAPACGLVTALVSAAVIFGGARRISDAASYCVPFMAALYMAATVVVMFKFSDGIGTAFADIFRGAFGGFRPAVGGVAGFSLATAMRCGVVRGVFSNEAGAGSSPIAHACADTDDADAQARLGIVEVFVDTIVICTATAVALLASDAMIPYGDASADGVVLMRYAFAPVFGDKGAALILASSILLFAFTAIIGWSLYGSVCASYLLKNRFGKLFPLLYCAMIPVGAMMDVGVVWSMAELSNALMSIPNIIAVLALSGVVTRGCALRSDS